MTVVRISDADPAMLRYFSDLGLTLDAKLIIHQQRPYTDATAITLSGQQKISTSGPQPPTPYGSPPLTKCRHEQEHADDGYPGHRRTVITCPFPK